MSNQSDAALVLAPQQLVRPTSSRWESSCKKWVADLGETWGGRTPLLEDTSSG